MGSVPWLPVGCQHVQRCCLIRTPPRVKMGPVFTARGTLSMDFQDMQQCCLRRSAGCVAMASVRGLPLGQANVRIRCPWWPRRGVAMGSVSGVPVECVYVLLCCLAWSPASAAMGTVTKRDRGGTPPIPMPMGLKDVLCCRQQWPPGSPAMGSVSSPPRCSLPVGLKYVRRGGQRWSSGSPKMGPFQGLPVGHEHLCRGCWRRPPRSVALGEVSTRRGIAPGSPMSMGRGYLQGARRA